MRMNLLFLLQVDFVLRQKKLTKYQLVEKRKDYYISCKRKC